MAAYTAIDDPSVYFQIKDYTGNGTAIGSGGNSITFDGDTDLAPGLLWLKRTDSTASHEVHDVVRGAQIRSYPDTSDAEDTGVTEGVNAFTSDGFNLGNSGGGNASGGTYVAYCWAETATAGFDIVTYTGTGSGTTFAHSLSAKPGWMLAKNRGATGGWMMWHKGLPDTGDKVLYFHLTSAMQDEQMFNDTEPTSSVFSVSADSNLSSNTYFNYLWAEKQGFSKFGKYEGNGNANGPFIYTGFKPRMLIAKSIDSTAGAYMIPSKKNWVNGDTYYHYVYSNTTRSNGAFVDFHSNGFKLRKNDDINNAETYVYMAFAESPFVNSNGVPTTAR